MSRNLGWHVRRSAESDCRAAALPELKLAIRERYGTVRSLLPAGACGCQRGNPDSVVQRW